MSFIKEGRWKKALALKSDYYLIQFGHNDQPDQGHVTCLSAGLEHLTIEMPQKIVGRKWLKTFPPRSAKRERPSR